MASQNLKIYLTHNKMILTNEQGFRIECNVPIPGNFVGVEVGQDSFHICFYPPEAPSSPSPNVSPYDPNEESSSLSTPSDHDEDPGNANQN